MTPPFSIEIVAKETITVVEAAGHPFCTKLTETIEAVGFDAFCGERCQRFYSKMSVWGGRR